MNTRVKKPELIKDSKMYLSKLEISLIKVISNHYPISTKEVYDVYLHTTSIDDTIKVLEESLKNAVDIYAILEALQKKIT